MCELCPVVFSYGTFDILSKLVTPAIAVAVAVIAFLQWKTNRATVREKLFDRRFDVFVETQTFLTKIRQDLRFDQQDLNKFTDAYQRSSFLFDENIEKYLLKIRSRALHLERSTARMNSTHDAGNRIKHVADRHEEAIWLEDQLTVIFLKFKPYLSFARDK